MASPSEHEEMLVEAYITSDLSNTPASWWNYSHFVDEVECKRFTNTLAVDFRAASVRVGIVCFQILSTKPLPFIHPTYTPPVHQS